MYKLINGKGGSSHDEKFMPIEYDEKLKQMNKRVSQVQIEE